MTLDPATGDIILACPNFSDTAYPGVLMRIDRKNRLSVYFPMPVHPETKRGCPMGMDFGPDGNLYVADNQYFYDKDHQSRLVRVVIENGEPVAAEVAVDGFKLANAVIWKGDSVYVSDTFFDLYEDKGSSGIYRFTLSELEGGTVMLEPAPNDPHLVATFTTSADVRGDIAGADGLAFDGEGNLYTGNFGDGVMYKIGFEGREAVSSEVFVRDEKMTCVDGLFFDSKANLIYVADMEKNAVQAVSLDGGVATLWENGDNDGSAGLLDGPCESLVRGDELIIANFDVRFPGLRNTGHDKPHTLSVIDLDR
jgi:DNA-binding beta-propeller fold protein YncE